MTPESRSQTAGLRGRGINLPPPFRPVVLREAGDAFAHAVAHADALGAGALVFVGRFNLAEFAVVLEPDEVLASARLAFYVGMAALANALAALAPPEKPITIVWPDAIQVDGGLVGGGRLAWPTSADERATPDWLVFGATIRVASLSDVAPGLYPLATALEVEGFGEIGAERVVETFARHLMAAIDRWRESGFPSLIREYAARLEKGSGLDIDVEGNAHVRREGTEISRSLRTALSQPSWLDTASAEPRL